MTVSVESCVWLCLQSSKKGNLSSLRSTDSCRERMMSEIAEPKKLVKDLQNATTVQVICFLVYSFHFISEPRNRKEFLSYSRKTFRSMKQS